MLEFYNRIAKRLYGFRSAIWVLSVLSVAAFAGVLFLAGGVIDGSYALAALTLLLWSLWMLAFAYGFVEPVPAVDPAARFWTRLRARLKLGFLWMLAVAMAGLMIVAVIMTVRTIGILFDA